MRLWHIAVLLMGGIVAGILFPGRLTAIFGQATLYVFLPALIFEAAWNLDFHVVRRAWRPIALLAVPGVAITAAIIGICVHYVGNLGWNSALVLGAILSATDPIAVVTIFRRLPVPRALATIVESESLLNDAVAVVLYRAVIAAAVLSAIAGVVLGIALGVAFAFAAAFALRERVGAPAQSAATFIGAYGVYFLTDRLHGSGIFAVLAFGIALRELERRSITLNAAKGVERAWDVSATLANVVLYFLIGSALDLTRLAGSLPAAAVTLGAVLLARAAISYGLLSIARPRMRRSWMEAVRMAGIRGALSLALAFATPAMLPQRGIVIDATFIVVVATLLAGTLTLEPRLAKLQLTDS